MINIELINLGLAIVAAFSVVFGIYNYFRKPQEDQEQKLALQEKDIGGKATLLQQRETENKASLLAEQVKWDKEANDRKFTEMGMRIDKAFEVAQNHINTIETEVKNQTVNINALTNKVTELTTIIHERIPSHGL